jgi:hypothetical protein
LDNGGIGVPLRGERLSSSPERSDLPWGPPSTLLYWCGSPEVEEAAKAACLLSYGDEVKHAWSYASISSYILLVWCSVKRKEFYV